MITLADLTDYITITHMRVNDDLVFKVSFIKLIYRSIITDKLHRVPKKPSP